MADTALLLQGIAGYDRQDTASIDTLVPDYFSALREKTSSLRIGIPRAKFYEALDPDIEAAVTEALKVLGRLTARLTEVELPSASGLATPIINAEAYTFHQSHFSSHKKNQRGDPRDVLSERSV